MASEHPRATRVMHMTTVHPRYDTRIFRKMCRSLAARGCETHLCVADGAGEETLHGVHIHDAGRPASRFTRVAGSGAKLFRHALRLRPDICHIHDPELIPWAVLLKLTGRTVIYDIHEDYRDILQDAYYLPQPLRRFISHAYGVAEFLAGRLLDACIVTTAHMQRTLPLRRCVVIGNDVRLEEFTPTWHLPGKEQAVCCVSVLHHSRCVIEMVDAAGHSGVTLYLAGHYYSDTLRAEAMQRPGWTQVRELGYIDRRQMQEVFSRSRAGLLLLTPRPAYEHSSCNKLYEYMAAGLPVIASNLTFTREVVEKHACGLLVDAGDPDAVAAAIRWVMTHPAEAAAMGRRGRDAVEREYHWEKQEAILFSLYDSLIRA